MLKMNPDGEKYLAEVRAFADKIGMRDDLEQNLKRLGEFACPPEDLHVTTCELYKDWAPYSFAFNLLKRQADGSYNFWMNGGLIFHGPNDHGGRETLSVQLVERQGWSLHT